MKRYITILLSAFWLILPCHPAFSDQQIVPLGTKKETNTQLDARMELLPVIVDLGTAQTAQGKLMVQEAQVYFGKMFANPISIENDGKVHAAVVLGTPGTNPLIESMVQSGKLTLPQGANADQGYSIKTIDGTIYVAGLTEIGVLYGLYALLEDYGAYFQISGELLPEKTAFASKQLDVSASPVFKYRGIMPWDNFLCGGSGYNEEDWQGLITRATRMKLNKLDLHFYPGYVMYNEVWDEKPIAPTWTAQPNDFAPQGKPGAKAFGDSKFFCVRNWEDNKSDPIKAAADSQAMMRRIIDYSHERGWSVAAGFSLMTPHGGDFIKTQKSGGPGSVNVPDPLQEKNVELSLERYRRLQQIYPNADYYYLFQTEAGSVLYREVGKEPGAEEMREKYAYWAPPDRGGDIDYAYLFWQVAKRLTPQERAKLSTGGWAIQPLFPGIDKDFPKEIIFASLNSADSARGLVDAENYKVSLNGRRSWMIDWWEFDGNEWFPQFRVGWQEKLYKKASADNVEGVTVLGWKLSAVEHDVRYLADFAWNPTLTANDFYRSYVEHIYGAAGVDKILPIYEAYDDWEARTPPATPGDDRHMLLGAGWCSLALPDVPFSKDAFASDKWKHTVKRAGEIKLDQQALLDRDRYSVTALQGALPSLSGPGQSWAMLLINRLEFRSLYLQSVQALNQALVDYDQVTMAHGMRAGAKAAKADLDNSLQLAGQAIEKYADDVRNRSDLGVIGQMNVQFYDIIAQLDRKFELESPYVTLDWQALRMNVNYRSDLANPKTWPKRDGTVTTIPFVDAGTHALRVSLAGPPAKTGSIFIRNSSVDLTKEPLMDFYIRTTTKEPVALMFQVEGGDTWYELDLMGSQKLYAQIDRISPVLEINDGQWHRITWNLQKLVNERLNPNLKSIKNLILGTWTNPPEPAVIEFKNVSFGSFNQLDGVETDR